MKSILLLLFCLALNGVEVSATLVRVIDGDTIETDIGKVRLLYIDTPESSANSHGKAMEEGKAATLFVSNLLPKDAKISLWGPKDEIEKDHYGRLLAVIWLHTKNDDVRRWADPNPPKDVKRDVNLAIIKAGWSPYWRKYGNAPESIHKDYLSAQEEAKENKLGAWATAPDYMTNKANETTAPNK